MHAPLENQFVTDLKFFDLLLEQFSGYEGELTMAIAYFTQALSEHHAGRRTTLIRIARTKIRHAETIGSILLHLAKGQSGPLPVTTNRRELTHFLTNKGLSNYNYDLANTFLDKTLLTDARSHNPFQYQNAPRVYLSANIMAEEKQITIYEKLIKLTKEPTFIVALTRIKQRQLQHREDLLELRRRVISRGKSDS